MALPKNKKLSSGGGLGNNKNKNNKNKNNKNTMLGGMGGYKGVRKGKVDKIVDAEIRKGVKGVKRQKQVVKNEARKDRRRIRTDYKRGVKDLKYIFGETRDYVGANNAKTQAAYDTASSDSSAAAAALRQQLGSTYTGAREAADSELSRLGIQQGGNPDQMARDQAFMTGQADVNSTNQQANLNMLQSGAGAVGDLMGSMVQGSHQSQLGRLQNFRNDSLSENRQNRTDQLNQMNQAIADIRGTRGDLFNQTLQQLQQTGWSQFMDLQQLRLQRQQANQYNRGTGTSSRRTSSSRSSSGSKGKSSSGNNKKNSSSGSLLKELIGRGLKP